MSCVVRFGGTPVVLVGVAVTVGRGVVDNNGDVEPPMLDGRENDDVYGFVVVVVVFDATEPNVEPVERSVLSKILVAVNPVFGNGAGAGVVGTVSVIVRTTTFGSVEPE